MGPPTLLVTAFEPFGGELVNPALEVLAGLAAEPPPDLGDLSLVTAALPVDRARVRPAVDALLVAHRPAMVIALGQATGRAEVQLEALAANRLRYDGAVDNGGHRDVDEPVDADGPEELPSTLPVERLSEQLRRLGLPVGVSRDAGRYLCNALLYHLLHRHPAVPTTFVHLPLLPEQAARRAKGEPGLPLERSAAVVRALLSLLAAAAPGPGRAVP